MFSDSFPDYKVFVFMPNFVLIILNFFFLRALKFVKSFKHHRTGICLFIFTLYSGS